MFKIVLKIYQSHYTGKELAIELLHKVSDLILILDTPPSPNTKYEGIIKTSDK